MNEIKRIKLYVNDNEKSKDVSQKLLNEFDNYGFILDNNQYDLAISIGGDGSFLRMVKDNKFNPNIYYIGINSGTLGFLQEINIDYCFDFLKKLSKNLYKIEELNIEETKIICENKEEVFSSLNEIVIRNADFNTIKIPIYVENELLENFTGDGILISTSTGSTAYNMSFGGSIVFNTLNTLQITPIAPLNNRVFSTLHNSVIIPGNKFITLIPKENNELFINIDGSIHNFNNVKKIETRIGLSTIKCIRMNEFHFIKVINEKILERG